jgi:hypothetical protein
MLQGVFEGVEILFWKSLELLLCDRGRHSLHLGLKRTEAAL